MVHSFLALRHALLSNLLHKARSGSAEALGELLQACRSYLLAVAHQELHAALRTKVDAADLVQETFMDAMRDFVTFRGETGPQLLCWLRGILRHNLIDLRRRFEANCRCLAQEVRLCEPMVDTRCIKSRSPIGRTICEQLMAQELHCALQTALARLPSAYREALQLHYQEDRCFAEIGHDLRRSPEAARKLVDRALHRLRRDMRAYA